MRASCALRRISALDPASLCSQYEFESIRARKRMWRGLCLRKNNFALGLQASLTHSPAKLAHSHSAARNLSSRDTTNKNMGRAMLSPYFWSKWRDSNSRPPVPETGALPPALHLVIQLIKYIINILKCQGKMQKSSKIFPKTY